MMRKASLREPQANVISLNMTDAAELARAQRELDAITWQMDKLVVDAKSHMQQNEQLFAGRPEELKIANEQRQARLKEDLAPLEASKALFDATLKLECEPWSADTFHRALARHPWMTGKVIAAIHWQALKLWWKGTPFYSNPGRGDHPETRIEATHDGT